MEELNMVKERLSQHDIELSFKVSPTIHDRQIELGNGWTIKIGRGFDIYQPPDNWLTVGANDYELRPCMETTADIFRA